MILIIIFGHHPWKHLQKHIQGQLHLDLWWSPTPPSLSHQCWLMARPLHHPGLRRREQGWLCQWCSHTHQGKGWWAQPGALWLGQRRVAGKRSLCVADELSKYHVGSHAGGPTLQCHTVKCWQFKLCQLRGFVRIYDINLLYSHSFFKLHLHRGCTKLCM